MSEQTGQPVVPPEPPKPMSFLEDVERKTTDKISFFEGVKAPKEDIDFIEEVREKIGNGQLGPHSPEGYALYRAEGWTSLEDALLKPDEKKLYIFLDPQAKSQQLKDKNQISKDEDWEQKEKSWKTTPYSTILHPTKVISYLGVGESGSVYLAEVGGLPFPVAVKIKKFLTDSQEPARRIRLLKEQMEQARDEFERACLCGKASNGVAGVYGEVAILDGRPAYAMEFIEGEEDYCPKDEDEIPMISSQLLQINKELMDRRLYFGGDTGAWLRQKNGTVKYIDFGRVQEVQPGQEMECVEKTKEVLKLETTSLLKRIKRREMDGGDNRYFWRDLDLELRITVEEEIEEKAVKIMDGLEDKLDALVCEPIPFHPDNPVVEVKRGRLIRKFDDLLLWSEAFREKEANWKEVDLSKDYELVEYGPANDRLLKDSESGEELIYSWSGLQLLEANPELQAALFRWNEDDLVRFQPEYLGEGGLGSVWKIKVEGVESGYAVVKFMDKNLLRKHATQRARYIEGGVVDGIESHKTQRYFESHGWPAARSYLATPDIQVLEYVGGNEADELKKDYGRFRAFYTAKGQNLFREMGEKRIIDIKGKKLDIQSQNIRQTPDGKFKILEIIG